MDQACRWTAHDDCLPQCCQGQVAVQPVAGRPANEAAGEQVDDDGQVQPALLCPDVGDVGAPFFVRACRREILIEQVRRHRPGVVTIRGPLEPPLLPRPQPILTHQARCPAAADMQAIVAQVSRHARAAVGAIRQRKGRPDMRQQHHVLVLAAAGRARARATRQPPHAADVGQPRAYARRSSAGRAPAARSSVPAPLRAHRDQREHHGLGTAWTDRARPR